MTPASVLKSYPLPAAVPSPVVPRTSFADAPAAGSPARRRSRGYIALLVGLLVLGAVLPTIGGGTGASFTATDTNGGNVFANGTVSLTDVAGSVISGANCTTASINGTCATLFAGSNTGFKPGGADVSNTATITYTGSITTGDFRLYAANYSSKAAGSGTFCTATNPGSVVDLLVAAGTNLVYPVASTATTAGITSGAAVTTISVASAPALASGAQVILYSAGTYQQFTTSGAVTAGATSIPVVSATAAATFASGSQMALQGTLDSFATAYAAAASGLQLKGGTNGAGTAGVWAANDSSVFTIKLHLDSTAGNTYQGCQSQSDLVWYASQ